jgi:hypothetical protein
VKVENSSRKDEGFSEAIAWKSAQKFFGLEIFFSLWSVLVALGGRDLGGWAVELSAKTVKGLF